MAAAFIFAFTYVALSLGRVPGFRSDRFAAAIIGAVLVVALRVLTLAEAQAAVDGTTLALLFGMMLLAAALDVSRAFTLAAYWLTRRAKTPFALLTAISVTSAVLSALLINDVVCIALTPLVLRVCESVKRDPKPYLLALATSSNVGSVATPTGNPQNILIASLSRISYGRFARALVPVAILALAVNVAIIWWFHKKDMGGPFEETRRRRPRVYARWVWKSTIVVGAVLVAFAVGVPPAIAALVGASMMMLTRAVNPKRLYVRVEWTLLALFASLFVVVAGVEKVGLPERLLHLLEPLHPETPWGLTAVSAVLSNIVSNVPAVMVLKSVIPRLPNPESSWLVLAMASTLAGNLTLPGSIASIIVVERASGHATITFRDFFKVGAPIAIATMLIGATWLRFFGP